MDKVEKAVQTFNSGFACSQAVVAAFVDELGIDLDTALGLASGFGGGIGSQGSVCGAVSGAVMVLGSKFGMKSQDPAEKKAVCSKKVREFYELFLKEHKSVNCSDLIDGDLRDPGFKEKFVEKQLKATICTPAVSQAVKILEQLLS